MWQEAATGDRFTDQKTIEEPSDKTRFWLGYDESAIYLAVYCYDSEPDRILMEETKRDVGLWRDDHITFEIDPYHTHNWNDFSSFSVNPRGTQSSDMGGGRSGKTEWKGDWQAASKVTADGWVTEMSIPWAILTYPSKEEPTTLGFNVRRSHARHHYESQYSNIGRTWRNEWAGDWVAVQLPASVFEPELLVLPFLAAGAAERDDAFDQTARGGLDIMLRELRNAGSWGSGAVPSGCSRVVAATAQLVRIQADLDGNGDCSSTTGEDVTFDLSVATSTCPGSIIRRNGRCLVGNVATAIAGRIFTYYDKNNTDLGLNPSLTGIKRVKVTFGVQMSNPDPRSRGRNPNITSSLSSSVEIRNR